MPGKLTRGTAGVLPRGETQPALGPCTSILWGADVVRPQRPLFTPSHLHASLTDLRMPAASPLWPAAGQVHLPGGLFVQCNSWTCKPSIVHMSFKRLRQKCWSHRIGDHSQSVNQISSPSLLSFSDFSNKTQYEQAIYFERTSMRPLQNIDSANLTQLFYFGRTL